MSEEELVLAIKSKFDGSGLKQAEGATLAVGKAADTTGGEFSRMGEMAANAAKVVVAGVAVAAGALVAFGRKAVLMASDVAESQSKVNVVFGDSADVINKLASTAATALGQTKGEVLAAAGTVGNLLTAMGMTKDAAAGMSVDMVQLATDLGSFNNASPVDVLAALRSGLTGEAEPMKKFGVALNEVAMKAASVKAGLGDNVQALSEAQKMQLRYNIIMDQTKTAQGDFARTSHGLANTMKIIKASFSDVVTEIGAKVLPIVEKAASAFATGFADAKSKGLDPFNAVLAGVADALTALGVDDAEAKVKAFGDAVGKAATFVKDDLWPALKTVGEKVVEVTGFLMKHKDIVLGVVVALAAFKTALAIQSLIQGVGKALTAMQIAWQLYTAGAGEAALATLGLDVALAPVSLVILAIALAIGLLAVAWKNDWGHIREHAEGVVIWVQNIPKYFEKTWADIKAALSDFFSGWKTVWVDLKTDPLKGFAELLLEIALIPVKMAKLGADIIAGLLGGLKRAWDGLMHWWGGKGNDIAAGFKKPLGIESPSRVFMEIGRDIILGLALGIQNNAHTAAEAMNDAVAAFLKFDDEGLIDNAKAKVADLVRRIWAARDAFLTGGAGERGSLAWLVAEWGANAPKFADVFAKLNIPVSDLAGFVTLMDRLQMEDPELAAATWGRFWDAMKTQQEAAHKARMDQLEAQAKKADEIGKAEAVRIARVIQNQRDAEAKSGAPASEIKDFDNLWRAAAENLRSLLELLNGGPINDIEKAFRDFWVDFNGGAVSGITNSQQLTEAIAALTDAAQKSYGKRGDAENANHEAIMANLEAQAAFIQTLIDDRAAAEQDLADLIALRQELLDAAAAAIKAQQAAQEAFEDKKHEQIVGFIEAEREARKTAHDTTMAGLKAIRDEEVKRHKNALDGIAQERTIEEGVHAARVKALTDEKNTLEDSFNAQEAHIKHLKVSLAQLAIDLGVEAQQSKLVALTEQLMHLKDVAGSFKIDPTGRGQLDQRRAAQVDRVVVRTDEQRDAIKQAIDSGKLSEAQLKQANFALLGHRVRAKDIADIMAVVAKQAEADVAAQQAIVDANAAKIKAAQDEIDLAEQKLAMDRDAAAERLAAIEAELKAETARNELAIADIDARAKAEDARSVAELARIDGLIAAETTLFDAQMDFLDRMAKAEDTRHAQRMSDIAAEAAYRLATLGMTPEEIAAFVAAAQEMAAKIAEEAKAEFDRAIAGLPGGGQSPVGGSGGSGGEGPPAGPGGPGDRPLVLTGTTTVKEASVDEVNFGGLSVTPTFTVKLDSRDIAGTIIDALLGDVTLVDKLGKKLNERKATTP